MTGHGNAPGAGKLLDSPAPVVAPEEAVGLARRIFGIEAEAVPLSSERDANFRLRDRRGGPSS